MQDFAHSTGLDPPTTSPKRYLWTDAFAVCNYLGLFQWTHDPIYLEIAQCLVDQVHHVLGRHRTDDLRKGWISGLKEQEGESHPTIGGLRIGKNLHERMSNEPFNERHEWERDGQYYHYLTKWMHALNRMGQVTGDPVYIRWAIELAKTAHPRFTFIPRTGGMKRMVWKMSIDLSYPLVSSMGLHDPLDGLVTYSELQIPADLHLGNLQLPPLSTEIADMAEMCRGRDWATDDPLGIGGLLFDASRITRLIVRGGFSYPDLLESVVDSALRGMRAFENSKLLQLSSSHRLAFRELGLSIGLKGLLDLSGIIKENSSTFGPKGPLHRKIEEMMKYIPLAEEIEKFWLDEENRKSGVWKEQREINMVMLATSLDPTGFSTI